MISSPDWKPVSKNTDTNGFVIGLEQCTLTDVKKYQSFVEQDGMRMWESGIYNAADAADEPQRQKKETDEDFSARVKTADFIRSRLMPNESYPSILLQMAQRQVQRICEQQQMRIREAQEEALRLEQEEKDLAVYLAYERGRNIARIRNLLVGRWQ